MADPLLGPEKGSIAVLPMGTVPEAALSAVADHITLYFNYPSSILFPLETPLYAFDERRGQYNAAMIIKALETMNFEAHAKVIAVVNVDLFIPIFTHVMGEAQEGGRFALVSMYRLMKGRREGRRPSASKILERLVKIALHELGHLFDMVHCADENCIMHFSGNLEDMDRIMLDFCAYCETYLADALKRIIKPSKACFYGSKSK